MEQGRLPRGSHYAIVPVRERERGNLELPLRPLLKPTALLGAAVTTAATRFP